MQVFPFLLVLVVQDLSFAKTVFADGAVKVVEVCALFLGEIGSGDEFDDGGLTFGVAFLDFEFVGHDG